MAFKSDKVKLTGWTLSTTGEAGFTLKVNGQRVAELDLETANDLFRQMLVFVRVTGDDE